MKELTQKNCPNCTGPAICSICNNEICCKEKDDCLINGKYICKKCRKQKK